VIRSPGLAGEPPAWFGSDPDVPRASHAGPWLAQHGQFFAGWGRRATHDELPEIAAAQAARSGWAKVIGDWGPGEDFVPEKVLRAVVEAVHAVGGRVAVHSMNAAGGVAAVAAGVDSVEHGTWLDPDLVDQMARQGTALTPTLSVSLSHLPDVQQRPDGPRKDWFLGGIAAHGRLIPAAAEAGVTVLAGTDSRPHGRIADEIRALAGVGMTPHDALGAASWGARAFLGFPGLEPGAPADVVVYDEDPRLDFDQLTVPRAVVLRGTVMHRRS
jgi:imidazolonepropionase-like amidohydrolase